LSEQTNTPYSDRCQILADLWIRYKNEQDFQDFIQYNDLGLPLAYAVSYGIIEATDMADGFIDEAWNLLVTGLGFEEDTGFLSLDDMLDQSEAE
jgi:hypothetical protein